MMGRDGGLGGYLPLDLEFLKDLTNQTTKRVEIIRTKKSVRPRVGAMKFWYGR